MTDQSLFRDIAAALAFVRIPEPEKQQPTETKEEADERWRLFKLQREAYDTAASKLAENIDGADLRHQVMLRDSDILAALHAMALHRSSPMEREKAAQAKFVKVERNGDTCLVQFLDPAAEEA